MRLRTQKHTPEKLSDGWWRCGKCQKAWRTKPYKEDCQGIPNYQIRKERPKHLFTVRELAKKHLQPGDIRKPEGYVQMLNAPYWVYLYDIEKAVPEKQDEKREGQ